MRIPFRLLLTIGLALAAMCACDSSSLTKSGLDPQAFVSERDGKATALYTLRNPSGMEVCVTNFGARVVSVMVPDAAGEWRDVVLGFDSIEGYFPENNSDVFGACMGRYIDRIANGRFTLDGVEYQLSLNGGDNCIHGGYGGWHDKVFDVVEADRSHIRLMITSPDGEDGFPGNVTAFVTYTLTKDNRLEICHEATSDKPTVINMSNHSYFNLSGDPAGHKVTSDQLWINASAFTPMDAKVITTGEILPLEANPALDFRVPKPIGQDISQEGNEQLSFAHGYDFTWVLDTGRDMNIPAARLTCLENGIEMTVWTDEPGLHIYTSNFLNSRIPGKNGALYRQHDAVCLESQKYPDSVNKPHWPSTELRPGETYVARCTYGFSVME